MNKCILCQSYINNNIALSFLLNFGKYKKSKICPSCYQNFLHINNDNICSFCGREGKYQNDICNDCLKWKHYDTSGFVNRSLYHYNEAMSDYMYRYKFQGDYRLKDIFAEEFSNYIKNENKIVVPIPLNPSTLSVRGFNQVLGLLNEIEYISALKTIYSKKKLPQSSQTRNQRLKIAQPFEFVVYYKKYIQHKDILLIDDVYTTGTTIRYAARLLYRNGANSVSGLTLAR